MSTPPLIGQLIEALRCLPGVGPKSAQRMAYHMLERDREGARQLAEVLNEAVDKVGHCQQCRTLSETALCNLCASQKRERSLLCVVESPIDVQAIMQATDYRGLFFVLMGHLSPLDGIGPEDIGMDLLAERIRNDDIHEIILATNPTVEGEATAFYISDLAREADIPCTRIAHGVPLGGELEYIDKGTIAHAFSGRRKL